jgi:hypothetical protein
VEAKDLEEGVEAEAADAAAAATAESFSFTSRKNKRESNREILCYLNETSGNNRKDT